MLDPWGRLDKTLYKGPKDVNASNSTKSSFCFVNPAKEEEKMNGNIQQTLFEKLSAEMVRNQAEVLGRRVGFYQLKKSLGFGNFSEVKLGNHMLTGEKVAVKILDKTRLDMRTQRLIFREMQNMERLHHPNILRLYEVVESVTRLYLVLEYASGGELYTRINTHGRLPEEEAKMLFAQVVAAVKHMHERLIVHRDIKAENILICGPRKVKLADLGFSTLAAPGQHLTTFCGSPPYAAPELFTQDSYLGPPVDLWALGILLFFMVTGCMPFRAETVPLMKKLIIAGDFPKPPTLSPTCLDLVTAYLDPNPPTRISFSKVVQHPWMQGQEFPRSLKPYEQNPRFHTIDRPIEMNRDEVEARRILDSIGITDNHLKRAMGLGARSPVNGAYRIVLHLIHKNGDTPVMIPPVTKVSGNPPSIPAEKPTRKRNEASSSKTCNIL